MEGINLDLIMCGLLMEESSIKIASVQNQNYFMDKGRSLSLVKKKKNVLVLESSEVLLNFLLRVR